MVRGRGVTLRGDLTSSDRNTNAQPARMRWERPEYFKKITEKISDTKREQSTPWKREESKHHELKASLTMD